MLQDDAIDSAIVQYTCSAQTPWIQNIHTGPKEDWLHMDDLFELHVPVEERAKVYLAESLCKNLTLLLATAAVHERLFGANLLS